MTEACFECGQPAQHRHHVVPRSLGGTKTIPVCVRCHGLIHSREALAHPELTRKGMERKRLSGQRIGTIPYGKRLAKDGKQLLVNIRQAKVIEWMRRQRMQGSSLREICEELNRVGEPSATGRRFWQAATVSRIIGRECVRPRLRRHERPQIEPLDVSEEVQKQATLFDTRPRMTATPKD